ncbi:hypothetical protein ACVWZW_008415 [Bradyrhizobium sp. F1.13.4]
MLGRLVDRETQFIGPHRRRLVGTGVDQVERITIERAARDGNRVEGLACAVHAAERLQRGIVERLHAERDAIDAGGAIAGEARSLDAGRVCLQRDFDVFRHGPVLADGVEHSADGCRLHERGRAAAEKDRGDFAAGRTLRGRFDLTCEC